MKMKILILSGIIAGKLISPIYGAEFSLSDYFSAQNHVFENIDIYFDDMIKGKKSLTLNDRLDWMSEREISRHTKAKILVESSFLQRASLLSDKNAFFLFKQFRSWAKYHYEERPSENKFVSWVQKYMSMAIDTQRLIIQEEVYDLTFPEFGRYLAYLELSHKGKVRMNSGIVPLRFGELSTETEMDGSEFFIFHAALLPLTCHRVQHDKVFWAGCLKTFVDQEFTHSPQYYFCTWAKDGTPLSLYKINLPDGVSKNTPWTVKIQGNNAIVEYYDKTGKCKESLYSLSAFNKDHLD